MALTGEALELAGDGLVIITYTAEPDNPAAEALSLIASWGSAEQQTLTSE